MSRPSLTKEVTTPPNRYAVAVHPSAEVSFTAGEAALARDLLDGGAATRTGARDARRAARARRAPETRSAGRRERRCRRPSVRECEVRLRDRDASGSVTKGTFGTIACTSTRVRFPIGEIKPR